MREELNKLADDMADDLLDGLWKVLSNEAGLYKAALEIHRRLRALAERAPAGGEPHGYAYRYNSPLGGTELRFNGGREVNGGKPIEAVPYWLGAPPSQPVAPHFNLAVSPDLQARLDACATLMADWPDYMKRAAQSAPPSQPVAIGSGSRYEWREGHGIFDNERGSYLLLGDDEHASILWRALTSQPVALPDGWVAVPREMTEPMRDAMHDRIRILCDPYERSADIQNDLEVWAAILAAAPEVPRG
jgi:hypothetical protein